MGTQHGNPEKDGVDPGVLQVVDAVEASFDRVVSSAVDAIWEQVPAYGASPDERLHSDLTAHVRVIFRALLTSLREGRPARRGDFPITAAQAMHRVHQGISLSDFLQAFRIAQLTLWEGVLEVAQDDPRTRQAALSLVGHLMHVIEVGSSAAAEAYLDAQQHRLAESDRVRRDLLEDLLARRDLSHGPKQAMLRTAGLEPGVRLVVASATSIVPLADDRTLRDAVTAVRRHVSAGAQGLLVVRQDEIVGVAPVPPGGARAVVHNLERVIAELARDGVRLKLGISTVHTGPVEVPEAYAEACVARDGLGGEPGVLALALLSSFDYLVLRDDETARRLIRPEVRRFVEDDLTRGGALISTLLEYIASDLNAKIAAHRLHMHVNTAYYRLERIAERTGCDLRRFADVLELLIAVRLLGVHSSATPLSQTL
ncbi:helix-turn-helix domain-containing protein [Streptomyces sp. LHD-70]|uniref:PucR family transcriptional regulator n=1 Tax=Streptomyces sp. LHD-70 TaxID=3072140 RepID=UPI0028105127|nr:helix-turn-helix domain-containing protein [Streptomyces sp. LHD-70]MDQ8706094.1 helix-turn-helix domain-containing protein [Streptomyces sp. LHD-70]